MRALRFSKFQGLGNDFIVLDASSHGGWLSRQAAIRLCHRHRGIGADGVLTLLPPRCSDAVARLHIYNADGSVAEMCGNGLRCVTRFIAERSCAKDKKIVFDTDAGPRTGWLLASNAVRVTLGPVRLLVDEVELASSRVRVDGVAVSVGNPHMVLRPSIEHGGGVLDCARAMGPALEQHPLFPERINVGFPRQRGPRALELAVFERGAGLTQACGTGAAAAVAAAFRWGMFRGPEPVEVSLPGGSLEVAIDGDPSAASIAGDVLGSVEITGEAHHVFDGEVLVDDVEISDLPSGG